MIDTVVHIARVGDGHVRMVRSPVTGRPDVPWCVAEDLWRAIDVPDGVLEHLRRGIHDSGAPVRMVHVDGALMQVIPPWAMAAVCDGCGVKGFFPALMGAMRAAYPDLSAEARAALTLAAPSTFP